MIASLLRCVAAAVGAMILLGVSSCVYDPVPPPQVGALGPPPSGHIPGPGYADAGEHSGPGEDMDSSSSEDTDGEAGYPTGYKTDKPHQVISPFKPHNLIDISENPKTGKPFGSGDLVKDPSNQEIFRIP